MIEFKGCFCIFPDYIYLINIGWIQIRIDPELLPGSGTRKIQSWIRIRNKSFRIHNTDPTRGLHFTIPPHFLPSLNFLFLFSSFPVYCCLINIKPLESYKCGRIGCKREWRPSAAAAAASWWSSIAETAGPPRAATIHVQAARYDLGLLFPQLQRLPVGRPPGPHVKPRQPGMIWVKSGATTRTTR